MSALRTRLLSSVLRPFLVFAGCLAVAMLEACSSPEIKQQPLPFSSQKSVDGPDFLVFEKSVKSAPLADGTWDIEGALEQSSYVPVPAQYSAQGTAYVLRFRGTANQAEPAGPNSTYLLALVIPRVFLPSIKPSAGMRLHFVHKSLPAPELPLLGVRIVGAGGETLFLADAGGVWKPDVMPGGFVVDSTQTVAYVTTFLTPSGCRVRKQHFFGRVTLGNNTLEISPGEHKLVQGRDGTYSVAVLENFLVQAGQTCMEQPEKRFTYLVERVSP